MEVPEVDGPPPPPYSVTPKTAEEKALSDIPGRADRATPKTDEKRAPSDIPGRLDRATPTPNTSEKGAPSGIPDGRWDLACSIDVQGELLQLDSAGVPMWTMSDDIALLGDETYQRDGFTIQLAQSLAQVMVSSAAYSWICDANTFGGRLLMSRRDHVSLRNLGKHLVVFERTVVTEDRYRPPPKPRDDPKGSVKVELQSTDLWSITGTDIYQAEGDGDDLVIKSPQYFRLWDLARGKLRWETDYGGGRIHGFTKKYVVTEVGDWHLIERETGRTYGQFKLPHYPVFIDFNKKNHCGAVVSTSGLFLYKPCRKALFIFQIDDEHVEFRIWESAEDIQGSLVLRGNLDNLELELIGQTPTWTKGEETKPVYIVPWLKKMLMG